MRSWVHLGVRGYFFPLGAHIARFTGFAEKTALSLITKLPWKSISSQQCKTSLTGKLQGHPGQNSAKQLCKDRPFPGSSPLALHGNFSCGRRIIFRALTFKRAQTSFAKFRETIFLGTGPFLAVALLAGGWVGSWTSHGTGGRNLCFLERRSTYALAKPYSHLKPTRAK